jgi:hypothetical protein
VHVTDADLISETVEISSVIDVAVGRLDAWLDTMRGPGIGGYGGPVAHWWQQSLLYTGPGLDWRYEGIIIGYLQLWERSGDERWLLKACQAGDDLVDGQLEAGHYRASAFEINPATAGTPHEAACDVGLLRLALALRKNCSGDWRTYGLCAERNIRAFYVDKLWNTIAHSFQDSPGTLSFVPNKAATACEAIFLLAELSGNESLVDEYALPNLERILQHQVNEAGDRLDGAIAQNSFGTRVIAKYFPIYNARCVPALVCAYRWTASERYLDAALRVMRFIHRWTEEDGALPTVVYANRRTNRFPAWVAPLGDVLRAGDELSVYGGEMKAGATLERVLRGQDASGGIQTATGFAAQAGGPPGALPDARDLLHVVGWCDKAFRYLTGHTSKATLPIGSSRRFEQDCMFRGTAMRMAEDPATLEFRDRAGRQVYLWQKGQPWVKAASPEFWLR